MVCVCRLSRDVEHLETTGEIVVTVNCAAGGFFAEFTFPAAYPGPGSINWFNYIISGYCYIQLGDADKNVIKNDHKFMYLKNRGKPEGTIRPTISL